MLKPIAVAALVLSGAAFAQTATFTPASQQVQLLAPQLVPFAGSSGNFDSLVNGLTQGIPVTLTTLSPDGLVQIVTFMPGATLTPLDAARQLEAARQNLIVRGVATPTAQQLAVALMGGSLTTTAGTAPLTGVLNGTGGTSPIQVRNEFAPASALLAGSSALNLSASNAQALRTALTQGTPVTLTTAAGTVTFTVPGGPMGAVEVNQVLQLASALLAQQGIVNPTPDQIRIALLGGTLVGINGASVAVQGVLQGRITNTSNSQVTGTSNTPTTAAPVVTPLPAITGTDGVRRSNTAEGVNRPTQPATSTSRPRG